MHEPKLFKYELFKIFLTTAVVVLSSFIGYSQENRSDYPSFDKEKDILLAHFDCKTDVDDLHSIAALATILADGEYSEVRRKCLSA